MTENESAGPLMTGVWVPEIYSALVHLIETQGVESEHYNADRPPLAVVACDNALLKNDLAVAVMNYVINHRLMKVDRNFWQAIPERLGRESLESAFRVIAGRNDDMITATAAYRRYRAGMLGSFGAIRRAEGLEAAYLFAARMLRGQSEEAVQQIANDTLKLEFARNLETELVPAGSPFPAVNLANGLRCTLEIFDLLRVLKANGFQTWLCSGAEIHVLEALANELSFPKEQLIGLKMHCANGHLGDKPKDSLPVGEGRLELFLDAAGRSPVLVLGSSMADFELMENCEGLSLVIGQEDEDLLREADAHQWMVQPDLSL